MLDGDMMHKIRYADCEDGNGNLMWKDGYYLSTHDISSNLIYHNILTSDGELQVYYHKNIIIKFTGINNEVREVFGS